MVERLPDHGADGEVVPAAARPRDLGDEIVPPPPRHPRTLRPPPDLPLVIASPPALVKPELGRSRQYTLSLSLCPGRTCSTTGTSRRGPGRASSPSPPTPPDWRRTWPGNKQVFMMVRLKHRFPSIFMAIYCQHQRSIYHFYCTTITPLQLM